VDVLGVQYGLDPASGLRSSHTDPVRLTEFWLRMNGRFGTAYADSMARDQVLAPLGGRTVVEALAAGEDARVVWQAVCEVFEVPARER
jgi:hypothetical protein